MACFTKGYTVYSKGLSRSSGVGVGQIFSLVWVIGWVDLYEKIILNKSIPVIHSFLCKKRLRIGQVPTVIRLNPALSYIKRSRILRRFQK
jgi:hypothetical protein